MNFKMNVNHTKTEQALMIKKILVPLKACRIRPPHMSPCLESVITTGERAPKLNRI